MYICIYIYIHIYIYTYTYIHTYTTRRCDVTPLSGKICIYSNTYAYIHMHVRIVTRCAQHRRHVACMYTQRHDHFIHANLFWYIDIQSWGERERGKQALYMDYSVLGHAYIHMHECMYVNICMNTHTARVEEKNRASV